MQGNAKLALTVLQSVFDSNAVTPPPDAGTVDVTVRLNTVRVMGILPATPAALIRKVPFQFQGGFAIDPSSDLTDHTIDTYVPIWRVDDGPVHGISWEMCGRAKRSSLTAVRKGFPAAFPSDLACANVSYAGPDKTYNHVVSLAAGTHTLWTGLLVEVRSIPKRCPPRTPL